MAIFRTEDTKGKKEDLASFITMITRDETPFLSSIGNKKATAVFHEWQTDELAAPAANAPKLNPITLSSYSLFLLIQLRVSLLPLLLLQCFHQSRTH